MAQFLYFTVLLVLCVTADSLETATTSPQQQHTDETKDLCEVQSRESNPLLTAIIFKLYRFGFHLRELKNLRQLCWRLKYRKMFVVYRDRGL